MALHRIVKKLQKRKDGKRVYYYVNRTSGGRASRIDYENFLEEKQNFKDLYGDEYKKKLDSALRFIARAEKESKAKYKKEKEEILNETINERGFPIELTRPLNTSIKSLLTKVSSKGGIIAVISEGKTYLIEKGEDVLDFGLFIDEVLDWYFDKIKELYPKGKGKKKKKNSPFVIWENLLFFDSPLIQGTDLDKITGTEEHPLNKAKNENQSEFKSLKSEANKLFKQYFPHLKAVDINKEILKRLRNEQRDREPRKKRKGN